MKLSGYKEDSVEFALQRRRRHWLVFFNIYFVYVVLRRGMCRLGSDAADGMCLYIFHVFGERWTPHTHMEFAICFCSLKAGKGGSILGRMF